MRILYLQFTNPAGYPPLLHSSRILAEQGWDAVFLGTGAYGTDSLRGSLHPRVRWRRLGPFESGFKQKILYVRYCLWALWWTARWRPHWIYASDPLSCAAALLAARACGTPVLYHEHDSPCGGGCHPSLMRARYRLAHEARICVLPNQARVERFRRSTGRTGICLDVWNCPSRNEAGRPAPEKHDFIIHYHGNIGPALLPLSILEALSTIPAVRLDVIGYTTKGQENYTETFLAEAGRLGLLGRVRLRPAMARAEMLEETRKASLGIALMPMNSTNPNFESMVGASNKPFEYLACGVPVLVSSLPEWRAAFEAPGYGLSSDPRDARNIARALHWATERTSAMRLMGELGRRKVLAEWNYEHGFEPVLRFLMDAEQDRSGEAVNDGAGREPQLVLGQSGSMFNRNELAGPVRCIEKTSVSPWPAGALVC